MSNGRHRPCDQAYVSVALGPITSSSQRIDAEADGGVGGSRLTLPQAARAAANAPVFAQRLSAESARLVEAKKTPLTATMAKEAIAAAYTALTGETLSDSARAILTAQWAHETGHGASMFNFNFGGIKGVGPSGMTVAQRTREGFGTTERRIVDSFRAYASAEEGAKDYVQLLLARYGSAVAAAERGDASGFVRGLKEKGYFTGDPAAYERSVTSIANRISGPSGELQFAATRVEPAALPQEASPAANGGSPLGSVGANRQGARSRTDGREALTPMALLELSSDVGWAGSSIDSIAELSAVRALSMSDEITRAALRIAMDDSDSDRKREERRSLKP